MATKTFKIGLSNTDKQNMAQDVYERLLALTFPEYDTSTSYSVGDFVVYNDQLYKCIGATTGAWDSTKWQLATLNDLVSDIENAVQFVNDKANVDGNYPTMTVGVADNLSPYDEESGDDQDEPFNFQATGTGNGTQPDFATGSIALMKEKQGNTVVVNQLLGNQDFEQDMSWNGHNANLTYSSEGVTITPIVGSESNFGIAQSIKDSSNKKLLVFFVAKTNTNNGEATLRVRYPFTSESAVLSGSFQTFAFIGTGVTNDYEKENFLLQAGYINNATSIVMKQAFAIDLTQWFNGDIPQDLLDHPEHFFRYYQGSLAYNAGQLVNANGRYVKCIGRNQWDEEYTFTGISTITGQPASFSNRLTSKNFIRVNPNTDYHILRENFYVLEYDKDQNYLGLTTFKTSLYGYSDPTYKVFTTRPNCCYIKFANTGANAETTYSNDLTISLYYEGESGYDQYYPYELLTNNDTGTEVLRKAGNVADSKAPDGTIKRRVGYVDLSTLSWSYNSSYHIWTSADLEGTIKNGSYSQVSNAISDKWLCMAQADITTERQVFFVADDGQLYFYTDDDTNSPTGTLFYELAEPTTEQGTPYSENLVIDDFGSMDFAGANGVPQGNLIFYPVDYKAFIDTLYNYTEGTPSNIALKSDLSAYQPLMQDLTASLVINANLYTTNIKLFKIGNMVFLNISAANVSGSDIANGTKLFTLPSGAYNSGADMNFALATPLSAILYINTSGEITIDKAIVNSGRIDIYISFNV